MKNCETQMDEDKKEETHPTLYELENFLLKKFLSDNCPFDRVEIIKTLFDTFIVFSNCSNMLSSTDLLRFIRLFVNCFGIKADEIRERVNSTINMRDLDMNKNPFTWE